MIGNLPCVATALSMVTQSKIAGKGSLLFKSHMWKRIKQDHMG